CARERCNTRVCAGFFDYW
nr:immunoglobulin heavy chain junction region [Macaca mulatta]MOX60749.1 immunoglobulin heavy chain junction region [Macaca mulatta]MOX64661.1 immunoglobulin heavy chain junction region [Macaca mulatta]MOX68266.1 immunoglobulin heavy chain junction region [Macaca mulatta]